MAASRILVGVAGTRVDAGACSNALACYQRLDVWTSICNFRTRSGVSWRVAVMPFAGVLGQCKRSGPIA